MSKKKIRILGTGSFLAEQFVENKSLENVLELEEGWIEARTGMVSRYHILNEEASDLGKEAALIAIKDAGIRPEDIDLVIGVSGVPQQAIPSMSALIHKKLGLKRTQTFDVNATCLSFLSGLSIAAELIESQNYKNVLLVSADIASVGLNPNDPKTATLFGDGAAAVVVGPSGSFSSHIKASLFETWSESQDACLLEAAGTKLHLKEVSEKNRDKQYFQMNGLKLFKAAIPHAMNILDTLFKKTGVNMQNLDLCIPHQASPLALKVFHRQLIKHHGDFLCYFLNIVQSFGNMIATSLPHALDYAIKTKQLKRGDSFLMIGTSAGLSVGGMILEY